MADDSPGYLYPQAGRASGGVSEPAEWLADIEPMSIAWDAKGQPGLEALLETLRQDTTVPDWSENDLGRWLSYHQSKSPSYRDDILRHLRFMERYPGQPTMLHGTKFQFALSGHLYYQVRQQEERAGYGALQKDLKCLKMMARFLGLPDRIFPVAPPQPYVVREEMPTPEQVYALIHADYTRDAKRSVENAWVKHVLAHHFAVGARSPKEYWFMQVDAYKPGAGLLKIVEPKKQMRERLLFLEPTWIASATTRPSYDTWLVWRDRIGANSRAMYPNPTTGEDFATPNAFKQYLDRRVKAQFPWWHGYIARHWSVYARIIDAGFTDTAYNAVAEWHGHEKADMTRSVYGPGARAYSKSPLYGRNWISRAFAKPRAPTK